MLFASSWSPLLFVFCYISLFRFSISVFHFIGIIIKSFTKRRIMLDFQIHFIIPWEWNKKKKNTLLLISNMPNIRAIIGLIESGFCWCYCDCYCCTHCIFMCECEHKCACICDMYSIFHQTPHLLLELMCININPSTFSFIRAS